MKRQDADDRLVALQYAYYALAFALVDAGALDLEDLAARLAQATGVLQHRGRTGAATSLKAVFDDLIDQLENTD